MAGVGSGMREPGEPQEPPGEPQEPPGDNRHTNKESIIPEVALCAPGWGALRLDRGGWSGSYRGQWWGGVARAKAWRQVQGAGGWAPAQVQRRTWGGADASLQDGAGGSDKDRRVCLLDSSAAPEVG